MKTPTNLTELPSYISQNTIINAFKTYQVSVGEEATGFISPYYNFREEAEVFVLNYLIEKFGL